MEEIQQMEAGKIYLIESKASANSVYFETDKLAKLFFRYCDYYLKDYIQVKEYILNTDGWAMLIQVRSTKTIRKYYEKIETTRTSFKKDVVQVKAKPIWKILSERVRLFISTYVKMSNKILGRKGTLVRRKYGRYQFNNLTAAQDYVTKIRNDRHEMQQSKEKYRGFAEHFRMRKNILTNPLRSSLWLELVGETKHVVSEKLVEIFGCDLLVLQGLGNLVAPKFKLDKSPITPTNQTTKQLKQSKT